MPLPPEDASNVSLPSSVAPLRDLEGSEVDAYGGKAATLGLMMRHRLPVLDGCVIGADEYSQAIRAAGAEDLVNEFWSPAAARAGRASQSQLSADIAERL